MSKLFERQLEELHLQMIDMGQLCEKAISLCVRSLRSQGEGLAEQVFETDREIDEKEREIENLCLRLLLHQHPVARDLRAVSSALKMISDMERIGDQAADIADLSLYIEQGGDAFPAEIVDMAQDTVKMVTDSVEAFVKADLAFCRKVIRDDDRVDQEFNRVKARLAEILRSRADAVSVLDLLMTAKYFERIGDHAVNIAEWVEYSITGEHRSNEHQAGGISTSFRKF